MTDDTTPVHSPTPSQTVGPFFGSALRFEGDAEASSPSAVDALRVEGQLLDGAGAPVQDGVIEVWKGAQFARCLTDSEGAYHVVIAHPQATQLPDGRRLAPHLNVTVFARGLLRHLATRLYLPDEAAANSADPVLEAVPPDRRSTLIARHEGKVLHFDIRLQGEHETVFFTL